MFMSSSVRIFVQTLDSSTDRSRPEDVTEESSPPRRQAPANIDATGVNTEEFVAGAVVDPAVARFLGMRTATHPQGESDNLTLKEALYGLGKCRAKTEAEAPGARADAVARATTVQWDDIEGLLLEAHDPTTMQSRPPSTCSVASSVCTEGAQENEVIQ